MGTKTVSLHGPTYENPSYIHLYTSTEKCKTNTIQYIYTGVKNQLITKIALVLSSALLFIQKQSKIISKKSKHIINFTFYNEDSKITDHDK